jgi:hypothetical protein
MRPAPPRWAAFLFVEKEKNMSKQTAEPHWLELKKKISVKKAAELAGLSEDSFRRHYKGLIKKITPRRDVVELGDVLAIGSEKRGAA